MGHVLIKNVITCLLLPQAALLLRLDQDVVIFIRPILSLFHLCDIMHLHVLCLFLMLLYCL